MSLHNYHDRYGCFPPAHICDADGKPMHSWRVLLLPYMEGEVIYEQYYFSEPWNGPNNRQLAGLAPRSILDIYQCPKAGTAGTGFTNHVAVVGPGTMWSEEGRTAHDDASNWDKIVVIEITNSDIHWMEPRDLTLEEATGAIQSGVGPRIGSKHIGGILYVDGAGRVPVLRHDITADELRKLLTVGTGKPRLPSDSKQHGPKRK